MSTEQPETVAEFLQETPLLQAVKFPFHAHGPPGLPSKFMMECPACPERSVFLHTDMFDSKNTSNVRLCMPYVHAAHYQCQLCWKQSRVFLYTYEDTELQSSPPTDDDDGIEKFRIFRKVGQYPAWSAAPAEKKKLEKAIGKEGYRLYSKGCSSLACSFGIGAVAYFRRAIESSIDTLLQYTYDLAEEEGNQSIIDAVKDARRSKRAEDKLKLTTAHIPDSMKNYGGENPLKQLYDTFSQDIHYKSDEEAVIDALKLKTSMEHTFISLRSILQTARTYKKEMAEAMVKSEALQAKQNTDNSTNSPVTGKE